MNYPATIVIPLLRQVDSWLDQCVRSALTQSVPAQVIVVRSELTPPSNLQILGRLAQTYPNLQVLVEDRAGSFPGAINKGIQHASADRVGLLLSDDWLDRDAVAELIDETADIVSTGNTVHFADGRVNEAASKDASIAVFHACATLHDKASYLEHFFLFRTEFVLAAGGLDESLGNFPGIDDYDFIWTLLERGASVAIVEKRLYNYRDHENERLTLQNADLMICNLRKILRKHGVGGSEADRILDHHAPWFGQPVYRILNKRPAAGSDLDFEAICRYATHLGLKRFVLHGPLPKEYSAEGTRDRSHYRETGRQVSVATDRKGRTRIKAPFALFGNVICTQPEHASGLFWCLDLLRSGYVYVHSSTPTGAHRQSLIKQLVRNTLGRLDWTMAVRPSEHAAVQELATPRGPRYTPDPARILMVTSTFGRGGSERQLIATASAMVARGYDVHILALGMAAPGTPTMEHEIVELGIKPEFRTDFLSVEKPFLPSFDAEPLLKIYELPNWFSERAGPVGMAIRHKRPAVVHCWLEMPGIIAALAACALGVPRVVLGQRNALGYMEGAGYTPALRDLLAIAYPALAKNPNVTIVNNSASAARQYELRFGLPSNTIRVVYNGFAPGIVRKPASHEVSEFRRRYGLNDDTPIVGTLMRFVRNKDPELWIDAAAQVAAAKPEVHFLIGGYGEMEGAIASRIKALGLDDRVILLGAVEDIGLFFAAVDVVLLTSIAEGTPNVLIEAQAAGRPVVAPNVGGVAETMINRWSGRLVGARSAEHLAHAVVSVLDEDEWRRNAGPHGRAFVAERFNADRMIRETLDIYGLEFMVFGEDAKRTEGELEH